MAEIDAIGVAERVAAEDDGGLARRSRDRAGVRVALMVVVTYIT